MTRPAAVTATLVAALTLSACGATAPAPGGATGGARDDGVAAGLTQGAPRAEIDAQMGQEAGLERNPANFDETCVSYAYDRGGQARYVHAVFLDGTLARATDGHARICTYGTLVAEV